MRGPCFVVADLGLAESARALWEGCRPVLGPRAEVHFCRGPGRFLSASEARGLFPWADEGLDYGCGFAEAVSRGRPGLVVPLVADPAGAFQGMLEFTGIPYTGCGMTGVILASDPQWSAAVLESQGLPQGADGPPAAVAVAGNDASWVGTGDPDLRSLAQAVHRGLGLGGWSLVHARLEAGHWRWARAESVPDLAPGSPFRVSLEAGGLTLSQILELAIGAGRDRHRVERSLKNLYKDRV